VGTKVLIAEACHKYDTIGIDCVAMNVNDVICLGAEPLALVDYLALEKPRPKLVLEVMKGLRKGAILAGVSVVSGETAIVPDLVKSFDLSATVVGIVRKDRIITGALTKPGDLIFGLRSNGIHSNGLTLARKILARRRIDRRTARELLRPTRIYVKPVTKLLRAGLEIHGLAHITGGAYSKLKRIGTRANVGFRFNNLLEAPWIFKKIQATGGVSDREMHRTFNMGTGFLVICPRNAAAQVKKTLPEAREVGYVTRSPATVTISVNGEEVEIEKW
jgi:phosphoribosylformylglycinamidine cyclo-ligase